MSVGRNLQEMENVVTKGAAPAEPMQTGTGSITPGQTGAWEDLGGPTPENYRPDDASAALKTPGATLAQVKDVVNAKAAAAEAPHTSATPVAAPGQGMKEEAEDDEELVEGDEDLEADVEDDDEEEEVVAEAKKKTNKNKYNDEECDTDKEKMEEEFDIEEDVNALLAGEELSEEFQEKARTIFEAAIRSKVGEIKEQLQETYENALIEEVEFIKQELTDRVDSYLEYVADEWMQENALVIENGLKTEMTESFLSGMKELFEAHYVSIPEDKYDVLESMVEKLDEMEEKLNEQIEKNISLNKRLAESVADGILDQVSEGLAATQKDKLASLAEGVEFESEDQYREKLETLKESYFPSNKAPRARTETLSEGIASTPESISGSMATYLKTAGSLFSK